MRKGTSASTIVRPQEPFEAGKPEVPAESRPPRPPQWVLDLTQVGGTIGVRTAPGPTPFACSIRRGCDACLVSVELEDAGSMKPPAFDAVVGRMIRTAFGALSDTPAPHAVRIWNFLPGLYDRMRPGVDRYKAFNIARHRSFCELLGETAVGAGALPTASCVGHAGAGLAIHVLGAAQPGSPIENPRQVPAFAYSPRYGPRPPCFSRATVVKFAAGPRLLVGGTASVLGEDSVHGGSRAAQLDETLTNLGALIARARSAVGANPGPAFPGVLAARVYHKRPAERAWLKGHLPPRLARCAEFVRADICRDELLVEIELVVDPTAG